MAKAAERILPKLELPNVEQLFNELCSKPSDVITSQSEAASIWILFRPDDKIGDDLFQSMEARAFMQAALICAIQGSNLISFVEVMWKASVKPNATAATIIKKLLSHAKDKWFEKIKGEQPPLYGMVLSMINYQNSTYFDALKRNML